MKTCHHFGTYWCKVTHVNGVTDVRYCRDCGQAVEYRGAPISPEQEVQVGRAPMVRWPPATEGE